MLASFSIVPIGAGEELKEHVAKILALVEESGLSYRLGAMQSTVEGSPEEVMGPDHAVPRSDEGDIHKGPHLHHDRRSRRAVGEAPRKSEGRGRSPWKEAEP